MWRSTRIQQPAHLYQTFPGEFPGVMQLPEGCQSLTGLLLIIEYHDDDLFVHDAVPFVRDIHGMLMY